MSSASLIAPEPDDDPQARLFSEMPGDVRAAVLFREEKGDYTADRFFAQQPRLYVACVRLLGMEMPIEVIKDVLSVSDNTVRAVRERELSAVADFAAKQGKRRRSMMDRCLDRMAETVGSAEFKDVGIVYGVLSDKEAAANGNPTQIIGHLPMPATEEFRAWAQQNGMTLDVPMSVSPATGLEGEPEPQRREASPPAGDPPGAEDAAPPASET